MFWNPSETEKECITHNSPHVHHEAIEIDHSMRTLRVTIGYPPGGVGGGSALGFLVITQGDDLRLGIAIQ